MSLTPQTWVLVAATGLPFALLLLLRSHLSPSYKRLAAFGASAVVAAVGCYLQGTLTARDLAGDAVAIFLASQGVYHLLNSAGWIDAIAGTRGAAPAKISKDDLAHILAAANTVGAHDARLANLETTLATLGPVVASLLATPKAATPAAAPPSPAGHPAQSA